MGLNLVNVEEAFSDKFENDLSFDQLKKCIDTLSKALRGNTNWENTLNEITRLCFTVLWILFIMARHVHPDFPMMADWAILSRFKQSSMSPKCLFENQNRKAGEPRWHPSCFPDGELVLGSGADNNNLYLKTSDHTWVRVDFKPSTLFASLLKKKIEERTNSFSKIDQKIWQHADLIKFATI